MRGHRQRPPPPAEGRVYAKAQSCVRLEQIIWRKVSQTSLERQAWGWERAGQDSLFLGSPYFFNLCFLPFLSPLIPGRCVLVSQTGTFLFMHPPQAAVLHPANSSFQILPRENTPDPWLSSLSSKPGRSLGNWSRVQQGDSGAF